jgi:hypothetical protein
MMLRLPSVNGLLGKVMLWDGRSVLLGQLGDVSQQLRRGYGSLRSLGCKERARLLASASAGDRRISR